MNNLLFKQKNARKNAFYLQQAEKQFNDINEIAILFDLPQINKFDFPLFKDGENKVKQMRRLTDEA